MTINYQTVFVIKCTHLVKVSASNRVCIVEMNDYSTDRI